MIATRTGTSLRNISSKAAGAQDRPQHRLDSAQRPPGGERRVDLQVDGALVLDDPGQDVAEKVRVRGLERDALDLAADPERLELRKRIDDTLAGDIHLIERLHGGEPSGRALRGLCHDCVSSNASLDAQDAQSAASTAPPPLFNSPTRARCPGLGVVLDGEDAVAEGNAARRPKGP